MKILRTTLRSRSSRSALSAQRSAVRQHGFIALVSLLLIAAVTLAVGLTVSSLSIVETQSGLIREQTGQSFQVAEGCVEEAILRLQRDSNYPGGVLSLGDGSCTISVVRSGNSRIITADASVRSYRRLIESRVNVTGGAVAIEYWRETAP